jgi:hypothetical protein
VRATAVGIMSDAGGATTDVYTALGPVTRAIVAADMGAAPSNDGRCSVQRGRCGG